tara:strand:- start:1443 stop:1931 length:489 start_codon:yes stop_codon:yes gene_type:complete
MPDYSKAKIYLIKSPNTDMIYVGETTQELKKRFSKHKSEYKNKIGYCTSKIILASGDAYIELFELYPCNNRKESVKREKEVIKIFGDKCVNKYRFSDGKEYREANKDKKKEYDAKNKVEIAARQKEHYDANKDKIKEYQAKNRDKINAQRKARRAAKKLLFV